jgi:hypothetical protein
VRTKAWISHREYLQAIQTQKTTNLRDPIICASSRTLASYPRMPAKGIIMTRKSEADHHQVQPRITTIV